MENEPYEAIHTNNDGVVTETAVIFNGKRYETTNTGTGATLGYAELVSNNELKVFDAKEFFIGTGKNLTDFDSRGISDSIAYHLIIRN